MESTSFRDDIQGLRGLAVLLVVAFHIWPAWVPGGYVGVDVFFVISGYLITGLLKREIEQSGKIRLGRFFGKRVRRLLPAATVVLMLTGLGTLLLLPEFRWRDIGHDIAAAALYFHNWRLGWLSIDYLAVDEAAGPLRHFWSLSIEEQFYLGWPPLLLLLAGVTRGRSTPSSTILAASILVLLASFLASVRLTAESQEFAYFATHARAWEFALGAALAAIGGSGGHIRSSSRWLEFCGFAGFSMIVGSAVFYDADTSFPGYAAVVPTIGAALCLWSGESRNSRVYVSVISLPVLNWLGNISYSLYLWHWPLLVFALHVSGGELSTLAAFLVASTSLVVGYLSMRWVENPFREKSSVNDNAQFGGRFNSVLLLVSGTSLSVAVAYSLIALAGRSSMPLQVGPQSSVYPGAAALFGGLEKGPGVSYVPELKSARRDVPIVYGNGCHQGHEESVPRSCVVEKGSGEGTIVLAGDSHAAHWIPALQGVGEISGMEVVSYTKSGCAITAKDIDLRGRSYVECTEWSRQLLETLVKSKPALVVLSRYREPLLYAAATREESDLLAVEMYSELLREMRLAGLRVVVIRDTPKMTRDPLECLAEAGSCSVSRTEAMQGMDPLAIAAEREASVIDMTDAICLQDRCDYVVGNILVWRDTHHLTATYSRTTAPILARRLGLDAR
ncbi:acyltransferase family protein [Arenimonas aestuarii]